MKKFYSVVFEECQWPPRAWIDAASSLFDGKLPRHPSPPSTFSGMVHAFGENGAILEVEAMAELALGHPLLGSKPSIVLVED